MDELDASLASRLAASTLGHLTREWPNASGHVQAGPDDVGSPRMLHPIFFGSFDWHSCVHGWWQVMRLTRLFPSIAESASVKTLADSLFTASSVKRELAYFERPMGAGFERPYGWAWLLALHSELALRTDRPWAQTLAPLARAIADRFVRYLPKLTFPIRSGKHDSTAFALIFSLAWARAFDDSLAKVIEQNSLSWFGNDRDCRPWEPGGEDFLSPTLCEALLMREILRADFGGWIAGFFPEPFGPVTACLRVPSTVTDRADGRLAHLDGLNLSRAWCWNELAASLPDADRARSIADQHLAVSLPHIAEHYMGEHWLATFALLALDRS